MSSDPKERAQWARHQLDEAAALAAQQTAAGQGHSPMGAPLPFSADDMDAVTRAERARCAALAEAWGSESALAVKFPDASPGEWRIAALVAHAIAAEIRG